MPRNMSGYTAIAKVLVKNLDKKQIYFLFGLAAKFLHQLLLVRLP